MQPFEIHYARATWMNCTDERPWIIVEQVARDVYASFPISGQCYQGYCFFVDPDHPDFPATGLTKACFVHYTSLIELPASAFLRYKGFMGGQMLKAFLDEAGFT